jgi:hypothetical protein
MNKGFTWIGKSIVLGALLTGSVGVGGAIAVPFPARKFTEILQRGTHGIPAKVKIFLPSEVPDRYQNPPTPSNFLDGGYVVDFNRAYSLRDVNHMRLYGGFTEKLLKIKGNTTRIDLGGGIEAYYTRRIEGLTGVKIGIIEWKYNGAVYRLNHHIKRKNEAILIAKSAIQNTLGLQHIESSRENDEIEKSIPNAERSVVELPSEENNKVSTEVNVSAPLEIKDEEIQDETLASGSDVNSENFSNSGMDRDGTVDGSENTIIPDASVEEDAIASKPVDTTNSDAITAQPIENDNKHSHSGVYTSATPGIQTENALCGIKRVTFFGEGPGLCSDKRQRSRILFEDATAVRQTDGSTKIKAKFFNVGYADGTIEVYSRDGNLVDLKILDGYQPPTGFTESTVDVLKTPYYIFTSPYKMDDPRYGRPRKVEEITLPKGGYIKITKSSQIAQLYGIVGTLLDLFQAGGDLKSSYNPPSKVISQEVLVNFAKDTATKYTFSIYKSDPVLKAVSGHYDDLDLNKASTILEDFRAYALKFEEDRQALKSDNQISNVFRDIGLSTLNEGIETGSDRLLPGLGKAIKYVRSSGQFLNVLMKSAELSVAEKVGDENTIFIRDTSN